MNILQDFWAFNVQLDPLLQWHSHIDTVAGSVRSIRALHCLDGCSSDNALRIAYFHLVSTCHFNIRPDCRNVFSNMGIITLPLVYILQNLLWVQRNKDRYSVHEDVHNYGTNINKLIPICQRLTRCQNGLGFLAVKVKV